MTENGDKKEFGLPGVCGIALFTVLFCVLFPYLGFVSLAAVTAMTGVLVASWRNPLCFAVPLPGIAAAMLIWKSVPAGVILAALVLSGIVLGLVMRTHRSALRPFGRDLVCGDRRCGILHLLHRLLRRNFKRNGGFRRPLHRICFGNICGTCRK